MNPSTQGVAIADGGGEDDNEDGAEDDGEGGAEGHGERGRARGRRSGTRTTGSCGNM